MNKATLILLFTVNLLSFRESIAQEDTITQEKIMEKVAKYYPSIIASYQEIISKESSAQSALGAYDVHVSNHSYAVVKGYYRRRYVDQKISKSFTPLALKTYAGYSYGPGDFPPMFSVDSTNSLGSPYVGFSFSTLKNSTIDDLRTNLKNTNLDISIAKNNQSAIKIEIKKMALTQFWNWVGMIKIQEIYEQLLSLALDRDSIFKEKVSKGDMPKIMLIENNQYIAKRKSELLSTKLAKKQSGMDFSLFYRDDQGNPLIPVDTIAPREFPDHQQEINTKIFDKDKSIQLALERRPEFSSINLELQKNGNSFLLAQNSLLPQFDLYASLVRNRGCCDPTNYHHVYTIGFKFEIPIERNFAKGHLSAVTAQGQTLEYEKKLMHNKISIEIDKKLQAIQSLEKMISWAMQQVEMATELVQAENYKFKKGGSNLFLVNIREESYAHAKVSLIQAHVQYLISIVDYLGELAML